MNQKSSQHKPLIFGAAWRFFTVLAAVLALSITAFSYSSGKSNTQTTPGTEGVKTSSSGGEGVKQGTPRTTRSATSGTKGHGGGGGVRAPRYVPPPITPSAGAASLLNTEWRGPDFDDNLTRTYEFLPGGTLRMTGQDGTVYHGTWSQTGNRLHIDINGYTREGTIAGGVINGTGLVQGRPFTWRATRLAGTTTPTTAASVENTTWDWRDSNDNGYIYEYLPGGRLRATNTKSGQIITNCSWSQSGGTVTMTFDAGAEEQGAISRNQMGGTGSSGQGDQYTWTANKIANATNRGSADSLLGSMWRGPDSDDNLTRSFEFLGGNDLKMTGQDGTVYHGTWHQSGNLLHIDINGYTREGMVNGQVIEGSGFVQGRPFSWRANFMGRANAGGGDGGNIGGGVQGTLLNTTWRGPDFDDNLTRTYEFQPGGSLRMTGQDGTVYNGTWSQNGNRFHIDINGYTRDGVINGDQIDGTGIVQGRPFTWRANRVGSGGGGGGGPQSGSIVGTTWRGPDYDDNLTRTYEFQPGGSLRMTGQDGTVYNGTWSQSGNRIHIDINGYTREATIEGGRLNGTGVVQGRPFTWSADRVGSGGGGGGAAAVSLVGTTWRGPDYDDNLTRTYEFLSGGRLRMTGQDGTVYNGTWSQSGNRFHVDINGYTREGVINGNAIDGSGVVQGRPFTWSATRIN